MFQGQSEDSHQQLSVARRVVLWLARASADLTIDHLLSEASRLIFEESGDIRDESEFQPPPPSLVLPAGLGSSAPTTTLPRVRTISHEARALFSTQRPLQVLLK